VSKLEHGTLQPRGEVMFRIAEYFKLRIEDVFQRVGGNPPGSKFLAPICCLMATLLQRRMLRDERFSCPI
jgi:DNA-binding XRE family transcriptional regulator